MWTWLSYDFDPQVSIDQILSKANQGIVPGDIIVMHDNKKTAHRLKELLPQLIGIIRSKKLNFQKIETIDN